MQVLTEREAEKRGRQKGDQYLFQLDLLTNKNGNVQGMEKRDWVRDREMMMVIDAHTKGSVGRFANHSCEPNMFIQPVFIDHHDVRWPRLAFFALEDIEPLTELVYDYGYQIDSVQGKKLRCLCGTPSCRGFLY